jgi:hypothetical protein
VEYYRNTGGKVSYRAKGTGSRYIKKALLEQL